MQTVISNIGSVMASVWSLMDNNIAPGISCKSCFLFFMCLMIAVWCVRFLLFDD